MMPTYRYINRDRSLVLRDDHVIGWDPKLDRPTAEQHAPDNVNELKLWQDAGSPKPLAMPREEPGSEDGFELPLPTVTTASPLPITLGATGAAAPMMQAIAEPETISRLDHIVDELRHIPDIDTGGLKQQVVALADTVRAILQGGSSGGR